MSFIPFLRDYIDVVNTAYDDSLRGHGHPLILVTVTIVYLFGSLKYLLAYLLTFQWLRDLSFLPLILPQINLSLIEGKYLLEDPLSNVFTFLEAPTYENNKFFIGFLNSFFASLPFSIAHIISVRRLLVEGIPAGIASALGTVFGQCFFLLCILFGWNFFIVSFFSTEPFSYVIGITFVIILLYQIIKRKTINVVSFSDELTLIRFFLINLLLTWCEQTTLFQYMGKLSVNPESSFFEMYSLGNETKSILVLGSYVLGFVLGNLAITAIIGHILLLLHRFWLKRSGIGYVRSINRINVALLTLLLAFSFTSIPYYGWDFFLAKTAGFAPHDQSLAESWFYPSSQGDMGRKFSPRFINTETTIDIDLNAFDQGQYMPNKQYLRLHKPKHKKKSYREFLGTLMDKQELMNRNAERAKRGIVLSEKELKEEQYSMWKARQKARAEKRLQARIRRIQMGWTDVKTKKKALAQPHSFEALHFEGEEGWVHRFWHTLTGRNHQGLLKRVLEPTARAWSTLIEPPPPKKGIPIPWNSLFPFKFKRDDANSSLVEKRSREGLLPWDNTDNTETTLMPTLSRGLDEYDFFKNEPLDLEELSEREVENFSHYYRLTFSPFFARDARLEPRYEAERYLKRKYYSNALFRGLLTVSINSFLSRQPVDYSLSADLEKELFTKRQMLCNYYDTLRYYKDLTRTEDGALFKTFADRIYKQQFKGTLKIVSRFFSLTSSPDQNARMRNKRVFQLDQPLFERSPSKRDSLFHEELPVQNREAEDSEELQKEVKQSKKEKPFIEETDPTPFYAGWDDQLRKFVITNRILDKP